MAHRIIANATDLDALFTLLGNLKRSRRGSEHG